MYHRIDESFEILERNKRFCQPLDKLDTLLIEWTFLNAIQKVYFF